MKALAAKFDWHRLASERKTDIAGQYPRRQSRQNIVDARYALLMEHSCQHAPLLPRQRPNEGIGSFLARRLAPYPMRKDQFLGHATTHLDELIDDCFVGIDGA